MPIKIATERSDSKAPRTVNEIYLNDDIFAMAMMFYFSHMKNQFTLKRIQLLRCNIGSGKHILAVPKCGGFANMDHFPGKQQGDEWADFSVVAADPNKPHRRDSLRLPG